MEMRTGICGDEQMDAYSNSTLQSGGCNKIEFSIATHVKIPTVLHDAPEEVIEKWLEVLLGKLEKVEDSISFEVQVGPAGDGAEEK